MQKRAMKKLRKRTKN
ncbi:hypothetical protein [Lactobacillus sp. PV034]|nr:hypothetical protein FP432_03985 [Lactobacillus sp. PV034]